MSLFWILMSCGLFGEDPKEVTPPPEAAPVVAGTIVFAGTRPDGPQRLCTVRPDGSQQVCHDDTANAFPGPPSPDHSALAVVIAEDLEQGHRERLATWSPGQPIKPLTPWAGKVRSPIWKPDKSALWIATNVSGFSDIWTVPMDGSDATPFIEHPAGNFEPHVDPTGKRMLFASSRAGNAEIHLRAEDGTITQLTDHRSDDMKPQWAPDGSAMVWISARQGKRRVWIASPDGSNGKPLMPPTDTEHMDMAWSPDSTRLAITQQRIGNHIDIIVVDVIGRRQVGTIDTNQTEEHPAWSPDGSMIAFTCTEDTKSSICVATPKGRHRRTVATFAEGDAWLPRWLR